MLRLALVVCAGVVATACARGGDPLFDKLPDAAPADAVIEPVDAAVDAGPDTSVDAGPPDAASPGAGAGALCAAC